MGYEPTSQYPDREGKSLESQKKNSRIKKLKHDLKTQISRTEEANYTKGILQNILKSSIQYSIVGTDLDGKILVWNEGARRNYGYKAAEVVNKKNIRMLHKSEDVASGAVMEFMQRALLKGKAEEVFERVRKDGTHFTASVTLAIRQDDEYKPIGYVMISKDITQAKRMEAELIKSNQELEQFAYIASHDLKAPLRAIQRIACWIEEDNADKLDDKSKENLALLRQRAFRMSNLIDGILQYSRAGRVDLNIELIDTREVLDDIGESLNPDGRFTIQYPEYFPVFKTTKIPLIQVLSNLIGNSIKHHHRPNGTISIDIKDKGAFYFFAVTDDGPGIEPDFFLIKFLLYFKLLNQGMNLRQQA